MPGLMEVVDFPVPLGDMLSPASLQKAHEAIHSVEMLGLGSCWCFWNETYTSTHHQTWRSLKKNQLDDTLRCFYFNSFWFAAQPGGKELFACATAAAPASTSAVATAGVGAGAAGACADLRASKGVDGAASVSGHGAGAGHFGWMNVDCRVSFPMSDWEGLYLLGSFKTSCLFPL